MKSPFILEFSGGKMQTEFPSTADLGGFSKDMASSITYESPRLSVAAPYPGRPKGSDRAICRTVNGIVKVKLLNTDILKDSNSAGFFGTFTPIITAGLYGESVGVAGAIDIQQYYCSSVTGLYDYDLQRFKCNGDLGFRVFGSYANLMQNIFIRVVIQRGPALRSDSLNRRLKIDAVCSGVLMGADLR